MYELIILSLLMRNPAHGYLIAKIIGDMIGPFAKMSHGTLYPVLTKLEKAGLIVVSSTEDIPPQSGRNYRTFAITPVGQQRFHQLMMDTTSNPGEYQKFFLHKIPYLEFLQPLERLQLLDHYIVYCQTHILHLQAEAADLAQNVDVYAVISPTDLMRTLDVMQHTVDIWQVELEWVQKLQKRESSHCSKKELHDVEK